MTHDRVIFSEKQEKSKKTPTSRVFDRKNKDISGFHSNMPQACFEFTTNPNGYYWKLPWRHARVLRTLTHFHFNFGKVDLSYETIAKHSGCCDRTVKNALNRFRRDGLVSTFYRHMKTNLFKISIDFCRRNVLDALQEHIPVLRKVFYIGLLTSFSILKPTDSLLSCLQYKRLIFEETIIRNNRRISSVLASQKQDFSKKVKRVSNAMPGVYPYGMLNEETKAFLRDSSHNEQLALKFNTGYEDPFKVKYREKAFARNKQVFETYNNCQMFGGHPYKNPESGKWYNLPKERPVAPAKPIRENYVTKKENPFDVYPRKDQLRERCALRSKNTVLEEKEKHLFARAERQYEEALDKYKRELEIWIENNW